MPNMDVHTSEVHDMLPCPSSSEKGEVASLFFCDQGGADYSSARKHGVACIPDGMVSHVPWMERENEEKRASVFEMGRESALPVDASLGHTPFQEDEMLSWLQYPLDDTFSKSYCSEQHCEQPFTTFPLQSLLQVVNGEKLSASAKLIGKPGLDIGGKSVTTDSAMALGAQRAAGLVPQAGSEVFDTVHTTRQSCDEASTLKATNIVHIKDSVVNHSALGHGGKQSSMNFPFFSQRVAAMKSSIQILGASSSSSIKDRLLWQPVITQPKENLVFVDQSTSATNLTSLNPLGESESNVIKQGTDPIAQRSCDEVRCGNIGGQAEVELSTYIGTEFFEGGDVTLTSLSGESDYSTGKSAKDVSSKRPAEETECESKDTGGVASQENCPSITRTVSAKRTRAAEIHNQSERRRRNKINEKMRALQELIPNANKTDKASMLDEAIEYVKMLQAQLQLMSVKTGMVIPPIMMPPGMQYLSLQQRPNTLHMNMGRVGVDATSGGVGASPKPYFLGQPLPGHVYPQMVGYPPYGSPPVVHELQSHVHLNAMRNGPAFQPLQAHTNGATNVYNAKSDLRKEPKG